MMQSSSHCFAVLAYKESPYLEDCLVSLINQNHKSKIFISTATPSNYIDEIAKKYTIPVIVNAQKPGIASDWSFAYQAADSEYVTLAHQDDLYAPEYSEKMLRAAQTSEKNLITFCDYIELRESGETVSNLNLLIKRIILFPFFLIAPSISINFLKRSMLSLGSPISCPTVMYNKKNIGNFAFSTDFSINLDWDAWLKFADMQGSFAFAKQKLVKHRVHADSETSAGLRAGIRQSEDLKLFNRVWPSFLAKSISKVYALSYSSNK